MKALFTTANLIVTVLIVVFLVKAMYTVLEAGVESRLPADVPETIETRANPVQHETTMSRPDIGLILRRNLFKAALTPESQPMQPQPVVEDVSTLEKTSLALKLLGTATGPDPYAYAVIEDSRARSQELYHRGDTVQGAVIKSILRQKVVLTLNGKDQVLEMDMEDRSPAAMTSSSLEPVSAESSDSISIDRAEIDEATQNLNDLMKQVRIRPHFSSGKPDGLLIYGIRPDSLFDRLGLKNGDIISGVDGKEIQSVDDALALYQSLKSASSVNMQLKRRGKIKEISYYVQE